MLAIAAARTPRALTSSRAARSRFRHGARRPRRADRALRTLRRPTCPAVSSVRFALWSRRRLRGPREVALPCTAGARRGRLPLHAPDGGPGGVREIVYTRRRRDPRRGSGLRETRARSRTWRHGSRRRRRHLVRFAELRATRERVSSRRPSARLPWGGRFWTPVADRRGATRPPLPRAAVTTIPGTAARSSSSGCSPHMQTRACAEFDSSTCCEAAKTEGGAAQGRSTAPSSSCRTISRSGFRRRPRTPTASSSTTTPARARHRSRSRPITANPLFNSFMPRVVGPSFPQRPYYQNGSSAGRSGSGAPAASPASRDLQNLGMARTHLEGTTLLLGTSSEGRPARGREDVVGIGQAIGEALHIATSPTSTTARARRGASRVSGRTDGTTRRSSEAVAVRVYCPTSRPPLLDVSRQIRT